ncbi:MAG: GHMP kinase [Anaerolineae bacterium]|jgi:D-glycero-alpha-D-manno-heptose-7-phosphate kinase|nr:GHMP kinase [Anaerolineae bacterium]MCZ7552965.1 hypothetical protein [Anaerolineales bacterium]
MPSNAKPPLFVINALTPIRICDLGGWTDTWFAEHGRVLNIAVYPHVEVQVAVYPAGERSQRVIIHAENYGERYAMPRRSRLGGAEWGKHPLLEAAIEHMGLPDDLAIEAIIHSDAPGGASCGTSAAVTVALIGALDQLSAGRLSTHETALEAQKVETELLEQQSGIQDQICAAFGGINYIEMDHYPHAAVAPVQVSGAVWSELERRLALIYLGKTHRSSKIHEMVIRHLEDAGPNCQQLSDLRLTAPKARGALLAGDFKAFGAAMIENNAAQARLHPDLISPEARRVIEIAQKYNACGWKVNGAGGDGGSLTILGGEFSTVKRAMIREIEAENERFRQIPIRLSRDGLRVWKQVWQG